MSDVLSVDVFKPRPTGGTSNTGNVARTMFRNSIFFAELIGVDEELVYRIHVIWIALASGLPICPFKFEKFCQETRKLWDKECGWYGPCPSLHKVLEHGGEMIALFPPEITAGMLSEEPAECSNKDVKYIQKELAFQGDYEKKALQVFHRLLERSHPEIQQFYIKKKVENKHSHASYPSEVLDMCYTSDELLERMEVDQD